MVKAWREYNKLPEKVKKSLKSLNDLTGSEWAQLSKSVNTFNGGIAKKRKIHGAAYPVTLAKHFIKIFTNKGDTVLDPFVGVGTTLDAAQLLGRNGVGFDTNHEFIELAKKGIDPLDISNEDLQNDVKITLYEDTCLNLKSYIELESIDFILTSPPYSNLLNNTVEKFGGSYYYKNIYKDSRRELAKPYSSEKNDLGNLSWDEYCNNISHVMNDLFDVANQGTYNAWVVRDFRDMPEGIPYVNLHGKIIELATKAGWILTDIMVWDQTNQRHLVKLGGSKTRRFYLNIGHSYVVIFRKNIKGEYFRNEQ